MKQTTKGQVNTLTPAILALVFAGIVLVFGLVIMQEIRDTDIVQEGALNASNPSQILGSPTYNAANDTLIGIGSFADFWQIIVLAVVITIVIGLLLVVFGGQGRR